MDLGEVRYDDRGDGVDRSTVTTRTDEGTADLATVRTWFPGLEDTTFLDAACVGLAPVQARDAVAAFADEVLYCRERDASAHHVAMDEARRRAVPQVARLLGTDEDHVALVESTTHGLGIAASTIPLRPGDEVLIPDTEFLQVAIPWVKRAERDGIVVRPVTSRDGVLDLAAFEDAIGPRTRVVCCSTVQWSSGYRIDIAGLAEMCRARDIWLVADVIQEVGAMRVDLSEGGADFVTAGGHKWLNAPFGCGFLALSDRVLAELEPPTYGYLSLEPPEGGWPRYFGTPTITPFREYSFPRSARTFEIGGTANYPGAVGLAASLQLLNDLGADTIEAHIRRLADLLADELQAAGARLVSDPTPSARSGITVFRWYDTPEEDEALLQRLLSERILISIRYTAGVGGLRVSTHLYNTADDVHRLVDALRRLGR